ncbi:MAG: hypothetical protein KC468_13250, partial [Myxococcales bacterium]|nr:hypothetical protein [Myxococcales bacterium]
MDERRLGARVPAWGTAWAMATALAVPAGCGDADEATSEGSDAASASSSDAGGETTGGTTSGEGTTDPTSAATTSAATTPGTTEPTSATTGDDTATTGEPVELADVGHERELRAAWVATVYNINYPSSPGLDAAALEGELLAFLDVLEAYQLNAIVFQVRPESDAVYA